MSTAAHSRAAQPASAYEPLVVTQQGDVRWLRLNRPHRRNALDPELVSALDTAVSEADRDGTTRIVVIAGAGHSFCAGADLTYLRDLAAQGGDPMPLLAAVSACFTRIETMSKPVLAAVHGHVVAGGLELALACDLVVARAGTYIGDGHVRNGLIPAGGSTIRLPRRVGASLARWLLLSGELMPATAFLPSGFVHAVAPADTFDEVVNDVVAQLRAPTPSAQAQVKSLITQSDRLPAADALSSELDTFARHWHATDVEAGLTRFLDRSGRTHTLGAGAWIDTSAG